MKRMDSLNRKEGACETSAWKFPVYLEIRIKRQGKTANCTEGRILIYYSLSLSFIMHKKLSPKAIFSSELMKLEISCGCQCNRRPAYTKKKKKNLWMYWMRCQKGQKRGDFLLLALESLTRLHKIFCAVNVIRKYSFLDGLCYKTLAMWSFFY